MDSMTPPRGNMFTGIPDHLYNERIEILARGRDVRIERIISRGHGSAQGFWYDQDEDEWMMLLKGAARIRFEDCDAPALLEPGDFLHIPTHVRHRVEWTDPGRDTIWLAVFFPDVKKGA